MAKVEFTLEEFKEYELKRNKEIQDVVNNGKECVEMASKQILFLEDSIGELRTEIEDLEHENLLCKRAYLDMNAMQFALDEYAAGKKDTKELETVDFDNFEWHMVFKDLSMMKCLGISEEFAYDWILEEVERRKKETTYIKDEEVADIVNEINSTK